MDYDALERLVRLRDSGALTLEEFEKNKKVILEDTSTSIESEVDCEVSGLKNPIESIGYIGLIIALIGITIFAYAQFMYDPTISPVDLPSDSIAEIMDKLERANAGERIINFPRVAEQSRLFWLGSLLTVCGFGIFVYDRKFRS